MRLNRQQGRPGPAPGKLQKNAAILGGIAVLCCSHVAHSQAQTTTEAASSPLPDVVVTATRRSTENQQTPMAITAVSGDLLETQGANTLTDIAAEIPGLGAITGGMGQTRFSLRGLATSGSNFQTQQPVGFYLDDTPITLPNVYYAGQWDPGFFDMARLEVLRGPQGTLYGAGALGGAVRIISNQPDPGQFEARVRGSAAYVYNGSPNASLDAMLNVPIAANTLAWRTVVSVRGLGGYIDQITPDGEKFPRVNGQDFSSARTTLAWTPTASVTLTPELYYQRGTSNANPEIDGVGVPPKDPTRIGWLTEPSSDLLNLASLNLRVDGSWFSLNSNNSYFSRLWNGQPDYSDAYTHPWYTTLHPAYSTFAIRTEAATSETRLQSNGTGPLQWLLGAYYQRQLNHQVQDVLVPGVSALTGGVYHGIPVVDDSVFFGITGYEVTQAAAFGELNYHASNKLTFTVGAREFDINSHVSRNLNGYEAGGPNAYDLFAHSTGLIPKYEISYQFDDSKMAYALASKGFRIGGPNNTIPASICAADLAQLGLSAPPTQFGPDSAWNYEVGEKSDWLNHRVRVNLAGYYIKWTNIQEFTNMSCGYGFTSNIATARSEGVELEAKAAFTDRWLAGGTLSQNSANFTASLAQAGIVDGDRLESAPETTASAYVDYNRFVPWSKTWTFTAHLEYEYNGNMQYAYPRQDPLYQYSPSWYLINGRIGFSKDTLSVSIYGNNLTNRIDYTAQNSYYTNFLQLIRAWMLPPRTIGIAIDKKF